MSDALRLVFHPDDATPTLHVYAGRAGIARLHSVFAELAGDAPSEIDLAALSGVESEGIVAVQLSQVETKDDFVPAVTVRTDRSGDAYMWWRRGSSGWQWCAEMIEPLLVSEGGHQYLTQSSGDEAEIQVERTASIRPGTG